MSFSNHDQQRLHDQPRWPTKPAEGGMPQFSVHTVLVAARCWWHIALPLGLLLASGAAVGVYYTSKPVYTAQAWLMIRSKPLYLVRDVSPDDPQRFVQNQIEMIKSPMVLAPVASNADVARAPELVNHLDPVQYLRNNLKVRNQGGSDLFTLEFTSRSAEKAKLIVDSVATEYRAQQNYHENDLNESTVAKLRLLLGYKHDDVEKLRARLDQLATAHPEAMATPARRNAEQSSAAATLLSLDTQLKTALVDQATVFATLEAAQELLAKEVYEPSANDLEAFVQSQPAVLQLNRLLDDDRAKLNEHKEKSVNPKNNPFLAQLEKKIKDAEAVREKSLSEMRIAGKADLTKLNKLQREREIATLQGRLKEIDARVKALNKLLGEQKGEEQQAAGSLLEFELARDDHDRAKNLHAALARRIDDMLTERDAPTRVDISRPAALPLRPDEEIPFKKMAMAAMAALCLPFGLAVGVELLFRRVCSRQQLEAGGQIAVVAEVTSLPARVKSQRGAAGRDRQLFEESIDGLRTYLSLVDSMHGRKVLAVTSAISREGKTSLASQLAVSVASAAGRPTLLIDGDMRSPDIHRIFDIERGPGLSETLRGECPVEEAIETGFSDTLHLLTAGHLSSSPHRILSNNRFADLIAKLGTMYHYIIIDTPPILAASEALLLARTADAAILCVRRDFSRVDQVADAFARLRTAGVQTAGAVLNGIPARHYAYRYGAYYYNRDRSPATDSAGEAPPARAAGLEVE